MMTETATVTQCDAALWAKVAVAVAVFNLFVLTVSYRLGAEICRYLRWWHKNFVKGK